MVLVTSGDTLSTGLIKTQILGPILEFLIQPFLGGTPKYVFLTNSWVKPMLMVWGRHCENVWFITMTKEAREPAP